MGVGTATPGGGTGVSVGTAIPATPGGDGSGCGHRRPGGVQARVWAPGAAVSWE